MIERIEGLPPNTLGFKAVGIVTGADYENVIVPAVEKKLSEYSHVRLLYQLGDEFSKFEMAALWQDTKVGLKHLPSWERIAVVTDVEWIRNVVRAFGFMMRGRLRIFANKDVSEAKEWLLEEASD